MLPVTIGLGIINFDLLINSTLGSLVSDQAPRAIDAAFRIYMLPQGMFSVAVATVLFPTLSRLRRARATSTACARTMATGMRQICLLLIPRRGVHARARRRRSCGSSTSTASSARTRPSASPTALFWFSFSLPFAGVNLLLTRTFFCSSARGSPTALAVGSLVVNAVVSLALYQPARDRRPGHRHGRRDAGDDAPAVRASCAASWAAGSRAAATLRRLVAMTAPSAAAGAVAWAVWWVARRRRSGAALIAQILSVGGGARRGRRGLRAARARGCASPRPQQVRAARVAAAPRLARGLSGDRGALVRPAPMADQAAHPQLLDHRPHRPRQVDAGRPHPRDDPHGRPRGDARAAAGLDGARARARDHDQGPGRARLLQRARRRDLPAAPHRHARATSTSPTRSRAALAACEGALLVVDASQGVEAQTVANTYLAIDAGLELIPCLNKIDLPGAEPERVGRGGRRAASASPPSTIRRISGKTGEGVDEVLERARRSACRRPAGDPDAPPRALIFDSEFDQYRGVDRLHPRRRRHLHARARRSARWPPAPRPTSTTSASSRPR